MNQPVIPVSVNAANTSAGDDPNNVLNLTPFKIIQAPDAHELADPGDKFLFRIKVQDPTAIWGVGGLRANAAGGAAELPGLLNSVFGKRVYGWFEKHVLAKLTQPQTAGQLHGIGGVPAGGAQGKGSPLAGISVEMGAPHGAGLSVSAPSVGGMPMSQISGLSSATAGLKGAGVGPAVNVSASPTASNSTPTSSAHAPVLAGR